MFVINIQRCRSDADREKINTAMHIVCAEMPYLSGLASFVQIDVDQRCSTACVFESGHVLVGGAFLDFLTCKELAFVLAHELLHLLYETHRRKDESDDATLVNIAHDLIINEILRNEIFTSLQNIPAEGLDWTEYYYSFCEHFPHKQWKPASFYSLEELVMTLKPLRNNIQRTSWLLHADVTSTSPPLKGGLDGGSLREMLSKAGITTENTSDETLKDAVTQQSLTDLLVPNDWDVLSDELERAMFPDLQPETISQQQRDIRAESVRSYSEAVLLDGLEKNENSLRAKLRGSETGNGSGMFQLLRGAYRTPWETALQRWFDAVMPGDRTFSRASRRGAWRTDVVLPGRKREGWTLHLVLDVSASMSDSFSKAFGAIDQFCENNRVEQIHILQCDTVVTVDEWIDTGQLTSYKITGFGGSDMSPAMLHLANDPTVEAVVVLTDGWILYPAETPPYETLWCIINGGNPQFNYGTIIPLEV